MSEGHKAPVRIPPPAGSTPLARLCEARGCRASGAGLSAEPASRPTGGGPPPQRSATEGAEVETLGVAVVDDDMDFRRVVLGVLYTAREFHCCGCFSTAAEALDAIPRLPVRIALVGLSLPDLCGIQCIHTLRLLRPGLRIVLTAAPNVDAAIVQRALAAGADGYWVKSAEAQRCLQLLRVIASQLAPARLRVPLTGREQEILAARAKGLSWKAIPGELGISPSLVGKLRQRIHRKLNAHSSVAAVNKWREAGRGGPGCDARKTDSNRRPTRAPTVTTYPVEGEPHVSKSKTDWTEAVPDAPGGGIFATLHRPCRVCRIRASPPLHEDYKKRA